MPRKKQAIKEEQEAAYLSPDPAEITLEIIRPITVAQLKAYLEKTGWTVKANHFDWTNKWTFRPEIKQPRDWLYMKPDPKRMEPFTLVAPGREEQRDYLSYLQYALETLAAAEETTFVTIVCRVRGIEQIILLPQK